MLGKKALFSIVFLILSCLAYGQDAFHLRMQRTWKGKDKDYQYHYLAESTFKLKPGNVVSGFVRWNITWGAGLFSKNIYETVEGNYDPDNKKISVNSYIDGQLFETYKITIKEDTTFFGTYAISDSEKERTIFGGKSGVIYGDYKVSHLKLPTDLVKADDSRFFGLWAKTDISVKDQSSPFFANHYVELHSNGAGISRNNESNTIKNVKVFAWAANKDTLTLAGTPYLYTLNNGVLHLKDLKNHLSADISFKKTSQNQTEKYLEHIPRDGAWGNWLMAAIIKKGKIYYCADTLKDPENQFFDIHPFSDESGEMIIYSYGNYAPKVTLDSLSFLNYKFTGYNSKAIYPAGGGGYFFNALDRHGCIDYNCYYFDGIITLCAKDELVYLVNVGNVHYDDLAALHKIINIHTNPFVPLMAPPGMHIEPCMACRGSGSADAGTESVYSYTYRNYNNVDIDVYRKEYKTKSCSVCGGKGYHYVKDDLGGKLVK